MGCLEGMVIGVDFEAGAELLGIGIGCDGFDVREGVTDGMAGGLEESRVGIVILEVRDRVDAVSLAWATVEGTACVMAGLVGIIEGGPIGRETEVGAGSDSGGCDSLRTDEDRASGAGVADA